MKHLHTSFLKNLKHNLKFIPIFLIYKIKRMLNIKRIFIDNDFELKKKKVSSFTQ